jgi:flavin reductase (DIM6/NTAB) family NADH-FMN oxidoreductase RutF
MASIDFHSYEPDQGHGLRHNPLNAIIAPRPIGWISSVDLQGVPNLAPYSFFNAFNYDPPIIGFSGISRTDSVRNAEDTGEFVWNLVTRELGEQMNATSAPVGSEVDEFTLAGVTAMPSRLVKAPRVGESRAAMECKVIHVVQYRDRHGVSLDGRMVLGEVVAVHIDKTLIQDGVYQTAKAMPIVRAGGLHDYVQILPENVFQIDRLPGAAMKEHHGA